MTGRPRNGYFAASINAAEKCCRSPSSTTPAPLGTTVINGTRQFLFRSAHLAKSMSKTDAANEYFRVVGAVQRDEAALAATIRTLHAIPRLRRFTPEVEIESTATGINVKPLLTKRRLTKRPRSVAARKKRAKKQGAKRRKKRKAEQQQRAHERALRDARWCEQEQNNMGLTIARFSSREARQTLPPGMLRRTAKRKRDTGRG